MTRNIPFVGWGQLLWLCPLPSFLHTPTFSLCGKKRALELSKHCLATARTVIYFGHKSKMYHYIVWYEENKFHHSQTWSNKLAYSSGSVGMVRIATYLWCCRWRFMLAQNLPLTWRSAPLKWNLSALNMETWSAALRLWTVSRRLLNISTSMEALTRMLSSQKMVCERFSFLSVLVSLLVLA